MKVKARLFGVLYSVVMAFCLAVVVSLAAASVGGHPITWESFGWSLLQGTVVGTVVGLVLPIRKMGDAWCAALGAETKLARALVTPLLIGTLFLVVLNFYFTAVNTGFATFMTDAGPVTFVARFMDGLAVLWAYVYVAVVLSDPLAFFVARKVTGFPPIEEGRPLGVPAATGAAGGDKKASAPARP